MKKKKLPKEKCICGKEYQPFMRKGKTKEGKIYYERVGYPELSCHCRCGKKWGEH